MRLNTLKPHPGSTSNAKRAGRGIGSKVKSLALEGIIRLALKADKCRYKDVYQKLDLVLV